MVKSKLDEQFNQVVDITRKAQTITSIPELAALIYFLNEHHQENQHKILSELKDLRCLIETRLPAPKKPSKSR